MKELAVLRIMDGVNSINSYLKEIEARRMKILIILFGFFTPLLLATTCINKEMRDNQVTVDNRLDVKLHFMPYRIKYDFFNFKKTKGTILEDTNYIVDAKSRKHIFYTPFCMKNFWDNTVIGDTLEILVFRTDTLANEETLDQLIFRKAYSKSLKFTYDQLKEEGCKVVISP